MIKKYALFFLCCIALLLGCFDDFPTVKYDKTIATLPAINPLASMGCQLTYSLNEKYNKLNDNSQLNAIRNAFKSWETVYPSLRFANVTDINALSNITIYFAIPSDSVIYKENIPEESFIKSAYDEVSTIVQKNNREVVIYLNANHEWTINQITKTIMFYAGYVLGLSPSDDPTSVMFPKLTEVLASINDTDKRRLRENFPRGCQIWIEKKLELADFYSYDAKIFKIGDRVFALHEDYPEFKLYEFNADKIKWEKRKGLTLKSKDSGLFISDLFVFGLSTKGYAGIAKDGYFDETESGEVWSYDLSKDEWNEEKDASFPNKYRVLNDVYSINGSVKGYVVMYEYGSIIIWEFDSSKNKWTKIVVPEAFEDNIGHFYYFVANSKKGYIFYLDPYYGDFYELNTSDNKWKSIVSSKMISSPHKVTPFSDNDNIYIAITDLDENYKILGHKMWVFNSDKGPGSQWEFLTDFPEKISKQELAFGFATKGRIFIQTTDNIVWEYLP